MSLNYDILNKKYFSISKISKDTDLYCIGKNNGIDFCYNLL